MEINTFEEEAVWYAPDYRDNRDLPKEQRFEVLVVPMTRRQLQRFDEANASGLSRGKKVNLLKRYHKVRDQTLLACVTGLRNLAVAPIKDGVRGEPREVIDVKDMLEAVPEVVIEDIATALKDQSTLAEGVLGNSVSQSAISA
jgi:hypothetical protein